jgi:hypothetical protein
MNRIKNSGLKVKTNINFPVNESRYKGIANYDFKVNNDDPIDKTEIYNHPDFNLLYEKKLGYI